jgi:hypothetical protein
MVALVFITCAWSRCSDPTRRAGSDPDHARRYQKEILCLAYWFLGEKTYSWHYDLMFVLMNLVIIFTNGGRRVLRQGLTIL